MESERDLLKELVSQVVDEKGGKFLNMLGRGLHTQAGKIADAIAKGDQDSPFSLEIRQYRIPAGFKPPKFRLFDGTQDPNDHVLQYKHTMTAWRHEDPLMCLMFPSSLTGEALI